MKALSLWQPWATLVAEGHKLVETRDWPTKHRGKVAIHATASVPAWLGKSRFDPVFNLAYAKAFKLDCWTAAAVVTHWEKLPRGAVVAIVDLVACEPVEQVRDELSEKERAFGNYTDGRYAWFFENVIPLLQPQPARGHQQVWNWNPEFYDFVVNGVKIV